MTHPCRLLSCFVLLLASCGGSSQVPPTAPEVGVTFPPAGAATDQETVVVVGTARSTTGEPVAAVHVDGVPATSTDNFATWRAEVPVAVGTNDLSVQATGAEGVSRSQTLRVRRTERMVARPDGLHVDTLSDRAWVVDRAGQLVEFDLATGARRRVDQSGPEFRRFNGSGYPVPDAQDVSVIGFNAYVTSANAVMRVDLQTGERSFFSLGHPGSQNVPASGTQSAGAIVGDVAGGRLYVCERQLKALVQIDLQTGVQTTIVQGEAQTGLRRSIALDESTGRVYAINETIYRIDPADGSVVEISAPGSGPDIAAGSGATLGPTGSVLYVADMERREIIQVDVFTGDRQVFAGSGVDLVDPRDVELDALRGRLVVVDAGLDALVAVDLTTGERTLLSPITVGQGPALHDLADIEYDGSGRLLGLRQQDVIEIDGSTRSSLAAFGESNRWRRLACDGSGFIYAVGDSPAALLEIDEGANTSRIVTNDLGVPGELLLDPNGAPLVLDTTWQTGTQELWRIDTGTGGRQAASGTLPYLWPARLASDDGSFIGLSATATANDPGNRIVRFDFDTATHENLGTYTPNLAPRGPAVPPPATSAQQEEVAVDGTARRLYLVSPGRVLRFDLATGSSEELTLTGMAVRRPVAAAFDAANGWVLVVDADWGGLLAIDAATGGTVLLAR